MPGFTAQSRSAAGCGLVVNRETARDFTAGCPTRLISRVTHDAAGLLAVAIADHTASTLYTARCGQLLLVSCAAWSVCLAHEAKNAGSDGAPGWVQTEACMVGGVAYWLAAFVA